LLQYSTPDLKINARLFPKAKNERALKKSAVSSPQSKDFLPPEKTNEKLFPALRDNPRRLRFALYVESLLEAN
jgi:hypothetical protein